MVLEFCRGKNTLVIALVFLAAFVRPPVTATSAWSSPSALEEAAARLEAEWTGDSVRRAAELNFSASAEFFKAGDVTGGARSLRRAARLQMMTGDQRHALRTLKQALRFNSQLPPLEAIKNLTLYSRVLIDAGDAPTGEAYVDSARRLARLSSDPAARGLVIRAGGELKERRGDFVAAETDYLEAVSLFREGNDEELLGGTLKLLAGARISLGKYSQGLENAEEAKRIFISSGRVRDAVLSQIIRGHFLGLVGRRQEGLDEYLDAEKKFPADIDLRGKAGLLGGIGYAYHDLGELRLSLVKRREAVEIFESEKNWIAAAYGLSMLTELNFKLGDEKAAFENVERGRELARRTRYYLGLAASHCFVGDHYSSKRADRRAIEYYNKALTVFARTKHSFMVATINNKLGTVFRRRGHSALARRHFSTALRLGRRMRNSFVEANTLFNLAGLESDEGRTLAALGLSQSAIDLTENLSTSVRNSRLRSSHFASVADRYELHVRLLMRAADESGDQTYVRKALQAAERSKARSMLENLALADADLVADAAPAMAKRDRELRASLHTASDRLSNSLSSGAGEEEVEKADEGIASLQNELEELHAELKRTSPVYSAIKDPPPFDIEGFQRNVLDDNSVLLEFSVGENESFVWVIDKREVLGFRLPPRRELTERVSALNDALRSREPRSGESIDRYQQRVAAAEEEYRPLARALSEILLGFASEKIRGKRLLIVADGPLHYLPFSALPFPDPGNDVPLLDTNEIVHQPSAQTLAFVTTLRDGSRQTNRRDLLVFSDPVFAAGDERFASGGNKAVANDGLSAAAGLRFVDSLSNLTRLRGSGREADSIVSAVGTSFTDVHSGFSANREAFLNSNLGGYKILHLATHAIADTERPERSGVVFSGIDPGGLPVDQLVRLLDIYGLRLNADLVVLSACETASGKELRGEGLLSLNNAFIQAGSRSVVSTLWKVDDEASQLFMSRFYAALASGHTPSESLTQAQRSLRNEPRFRSPFYWGAFTLHGDPNVRVRMSNSNFAVGLSAAVGGILISSIAALAWKRISRRRTTQT